MDLDPVMNTSEAEALCAAEGMLFFATSAKTGQNLDKMFRSLAHQGKNIQEKMVISI